MGTVLDIGFWVLLYDRWATQITLHVSGLRFWQFNPRQKLVSQFYHHTEWFRSFAIMNPA
jgi:hypothetical protein